MTNGDKFESIFGIYATEMWAMPESEFLNWLNSLHDVNATNTTDTINRQDAINTALEFFVEFLGGAFHEDDQKILVKRMNELPSAERKGYWIVDTNTLSIMLQKPRCSVCGDLAIGVPGLGYIPTNWCPNCGAKMEGVKIKGEKE